MSGTDAKKFTEWGNWTQKVDCSVLTRGAVARPFFITRTERAGWREFSGKPARHKEIHFDCGRLFHYIAVMESEVVLEAQDERRRWLRIVAILAFITISYNLIEGLVSIFFGADDESLSLFGFGVDSFVEVISGIGIAHMVWRMQNIGADVDSDRFEKTALRITGIGFIVLAVALPAGAIMSIVSDHRPDATVAGVIISLVSILTMWLLIREKRRAGAALQSQAVLADANCTRTCLQLSFVLLTASLLYELFRLPYVDAVGSLAIAWFAFREGRESFEKARTGKSCGCDGCH
ncbi:hypothetical protein Lepil_2567 [Leptonema illini DSM 21528]|jgi:divalent metal cation (Fe/Co/Zn/Cd) transporter|uniref:Cation efflux protein transmembrane domain-containing protein n=2 Tax=Leptonema illini TaxID=183 RepID=H2CKZ6_9LEPT|nr:hypothetical protein Lepil_2567 [Leptonema illini DSM 21528]